MTKVAEGLGVPPPPAERLPGRYLAAGRVGLLCKPLEHPWLPVALALPAILGPDLQCHLGHVPEVPCPPKQRSGGCGGSAPRRESAPAARIAWWCPCVLSSRCGPALGCTGEAARPTRCLLRAEKEGKPPSKEKKKKKKKSKEVGALPPTSGRPLGSVGSRRPHGLSHPPSQEEEKAARKKSKHKKTRDKEEGRQERRRRPRGTTERTAADELEAFLGGAAPSGHHRGGGDYEEL